MIAIELDDPKLLFEAGRELVRIKKYQTPYPSSSPAEWYDGVRALVNNRGYFRRIKGYIECLRRNLPERAEEFQREFSDLIRILDLGPTCANQKLCNI